MSRADASFPHSMGPGFVLAALTLVRAALPCAPSARATRSRCATPRAARWRSAIRPASCRSAARHGNSLCARARGSGSSRSTTTSFYPPQALQEKPNVGYMRALSPEGVLGLSPSLILASRRRRPEGSDRGAAAPRACRSCWCPTSTPARASSRRSIWSPPPPARAAAASAWRKAVQADLDALASVRQRVGKPLQRPVPAVVRERPADGGRPRHRRRRHHQARRRRQRHHRVRGLQARQRRGDHRGAPDAVLAMQRNSHPLDARTVFAHPAFALTPAAARAALRQHGRASISSASVRAPRSRRAISPPRSIPRSAPTRFPPSSGAALDDACRP